MRANVTLFPDKKQFEDNVWWDENLRKRSLEAAESEPAIWDDPYRDRLFYTGTNPRMTVDNAFEKLDLLQEDWVNGRLDPRQRARAVAIVYLIDKMSERARLLEDPAANHRASWNDAANRLVQYERRVGHRHPTYRLAQGLLPCQRCARRPRLSVLYAAPQVGRPTEALRSQVPQRVALRYRVQL